MDYSLSFSLLYSCENNENWNGRQIMIMELKRRGNGIYSSFFFFFSIFLLILKVITKLRRCEHLYYVCKTLPSAGSILCKPSGPEYKKNLLVKVRLCGTTLLLKCQTFLWCPRSSVSKKPKGKWNISRKRFGFIQPLLSPSLSTNVLEQSVISVLVNAPVISLRTFLHMICKSEKNWVTMDS